MTTDLAQRSSLLEVLTLLGGASALRYEAEQAPSLQQAALFLLGAHTSSSPSAAGLRFALAKAALEKDKEFATSAEAAGRLEPALATALRQLVVLTAKRLPPGTEGGSPLPALAGPDDLGPRLADQAYVELARGLGTKGQALARRVEANSPPRLAQVASGQAPLLTLWEPWLLDEATAQVRRYASLALVVWADVVRPVMVRERQSRKLAPTSVRRAGASYAKLPKVVPAMSWAIGGDGVAAKTVMLGSQKFVAEPNLITHATYVPKTWRLLPDQHPSRPHQTALPLDPRSTPEPPAAEALPLAVASVSSQVMSPSAGKLALLTLASEEVRQGKLAKATLAQLTRWTRPDLSRIQARDYEATGRGLDELRQLFLFLPDGSRVQLFDVTSPASPAQADPDMTLYYGLTQSLAVALERAALGALQGPQLRGHEYRGEFLINLSGAMRLPNNQPSLLRYYVRLAATWNATFSSASGAFDPERLKARPLEEWAALANSLQAGVADYLAAKKSGREASDRRRQLSVERKRAREDLESLAEQHHLIRLEGKGNLVLPLPPEDYLEAWELFRQNGGRPDDFDDHE